MAAWHDAPMPDDITLRSPAPDELIDFTRPLAAAFYEEFPDEEVVHGRELIEYDRLIGAFAGEERVGSAGAYSFRMTVPGGEVGTGGITAVAVRPDHRRRGILRKMLDWLLEDARRRQEPVAILTASEAAIYHRFGFGQASTVTAFSVDPARVRFRAPIPMPAGAAIRLVEIPEATTAFARVYDQVVTGIPGAVSRSEPRWRLFLVGDTESMRKGQGSKYNAVLEVDGEPRGYAIYRIQSGWGPTGPSSSMIVLEVTGLDPSAEQLLWQWLFSMDLVTTVEGRRGPNPHPLQHWLAEPRRLGLTVLDGLWLRILDLPAALSARTYVGGGSLVLEVSDPMFAGNDGRWELSIADGRATVSRTSSDPDLALDVAALAATYLGAFRFADLANAGHVRECRPGALLRADALFTPPRAPWCATPF